MFNLFNNNRRKHSRKRLLPTVLALILIISLGIFNYSLVMATDDQTPATSTKTDATTVNDNKATSQTTVVADASIATSDISEFPDNNPKADTKDKPDKAAVKSDTKDESPLVKDAPELDPAIAAAIRNDQKAINFSLDKPLVFTNKRSLKISDLNNLNSSLITAFTVDNQGEVEILAEQNSDKYFTPATMTKLFTALVAYDQLADRLNENIEIKPEDLAGLPEAGARVVGFEEGEVVSINDLFYGTIIDSGGDAAKALARLAYGSEQAFVQMMNETATKIGLKDTVFSDCTGLNLNGTDKTTTHDMAIITALAASRPVLVRMMTTPEYITTANSIHSHGLLMRSILFRDIIGLHQSDPNQKVYVQGGRPGWSPDAGFTMTSFTHLGKKILVAVTAGAEDGDSRFQDHVRLFNSLLGQFHQVKVFDPNQVIGKVPLQNSPVDHVQMKASNNGFVIDLPLILEAKDLIYKLEVPNVLKAPVPSGFQFGKLTIFFNDKQVHTEILITDRYYKTVVIKGIANVLTTAYLASPGAYYVTIILLIIGLLLFIVWFEKHLKVKRHRMENEAKIRLEQLERQKQLAEQEKNWQEYKSRTFSSNQNPYQPRNKTKPN